MDPSQFEKLIVGPTLTAIGLVSPAARTLMLGTAMIESNLKFLEQLNGPALGIYQIEDATYQDIHRYLNSYNKFRLKENCLAAAFYSAWPPNIALVHNLRWATIVARILYERIPEPLPYSFDSMALAGYYKKYYNTNDGKADVSRAAEVFKEASDIVGH